MSSAGAWRKHPPPARSRRRSLPALFSLQQRGALAAHPATSLSKASRHPRGSSVAPTEPQPRWDPTVLGLWHRQPPASLPAPLPGSQMVQPWDLVLLISPRPSRPSRGQVGAGSSNPPAPAGHHVRGLTLSCPAEARVPDLASALPEQQRH